MQISKENFEELEKAGDPAFREELKKTVLEESLDFFELDSEALRELLEKGDPRLKVGNLQKAKNLSASLKKAASTPGGLKKASKEVVQARLQVCAGCNFKHPKAWKCQKCGCHLKAKASLRGFECPLGKWGGLQKAEELKEYFDAVYCINLDRRPGRWEEFKKALPKDWPFVEVERWSAVDGKKAPRPDWWRGGGGAWGCYRSHLQIMEHALAKGLNRVLVLEDDCRFGKNFSQEVQAVLKTLPEDWGQVYLGGQHLKALKGVPKKVNEDWFMPFNVNRTHAYALQGEYIKTMYKHCNPKGWGTPHHIDHHMGRLHMKQDGKVFTPSVWLASQCAGRSDISGRKHAQRCWKSAGSYESRENELSHVPFVPILGLHSSGSSCLAGVVHALGLHLGNSLNKGYEPNFLHKRLTGSMEGHIWNTSLNPGGLEWLQYWVNQRKREALKRGILSGAKHPLMLSDVEDLKAAIGDSPKIIFSERPLEDSIRSMIKRGQRQRIKQPPEVLEAHQRWLWKHKEEMAEAFPEHLRISYYDVLANPVREAERIAEFLNVSISEDAKEQILKRVDPTKRRV